MGKNKLFYFSGRDEEWDRIIETAKRQGTSTSKILTDAVQKYLKRHDDRPQTNLPDFSEGGEMTVQRQEGTIRQNLLRPGRPVEFKNILQMLISEDVEPKERAAMGKRIASWLKDNGIQVTY